MGQPLRPQDTEGQEKLLSGAGEGIMGSWSLATWWQLGKQCESCGARGNQQRSPAESSPQENRIDARDTGNEGVRLRAQGPGQTCFDHVRV